MQRVFLRKAAKTIRILLGILFFSTGFMKLAVPDLRTAFSGQLTAGGIPFQSLNMWMVPTLEIGLGLLLILGLLPRLTVLSAVVLMAVATYVHVAVDDPSLFPLQPEKPIIPIVVMVLSLSLLWMRNEPGSSHEGSNRFPRKQPEGGDGADRHSLSCACGITHHEH